PYVRWLSANKAELLAVCDGEAVQTSLIVADHTPLKHPCSSEVLTTLSDSAIVAPRSSFEGIEKFFAVSDVEGHLQNFTSILQNQRIIDKNNRWIFGKGHLILLGDMVDRGEFVTEVLWMIHRLEGEAQRAGGRVHYLIGNHELMTLEGDTRYLNEKYLNSTKALRLDYKELFGPQTEFGRWLRTRNVIVRINDTLFVHAGLEPKFFSSNLSLTDINSKTQQGMVDPELEKSDKDVEYLLNSKGPLWYRGYFKDLGLTGKEIGVVLNRFDAKRIAVGHTIVPEIESRYEGLVIAIDTSFSKKAKVQGLLFDQGQFWRASLSGARDPL
ncbi:MAG: hypothetical protein EOP10_24090, partial [Proteobacteria bacterium]